MVDSITLERPKREEPCSSLWIIISHLRSIKWRYSQILIKSWRIFWVPAWYRLVFVQSIQTVQKYIEQLKSKLSLSLLSSDRIPPHHSLLFLSLFFIFKLKLFKIKIDFPDVPSEYYMHDIHQVTKTSPSLYYISHYNII